MLNLNKFQIHILFIEIRTEFRKFNFAIRKKCNI